MKKWSRIMVFSVLILGLLATTEKTATPAPIQLSLVTYTTPAEGRPTYCLKYFVDKIKERSRGRMEIIVRGGPEVFAPPDLLTKCKAGLVDLVFCPQTYWGATAPELGYDSLPFEVDWDGVSALLVEVRALADKVYNKHGCKIVVSNLFFPGSFYIWTKAPVHTMADLKGMTIRTFSVMSAVLVESLGASSVVISSAETVGALERGVVVGSIGAPPNAHDFKYWELGIKHCVFQPLFTALANGVIINQAAYNRLPPDLQKTLLDVGREADKYMAEYWKKQEVGIIADMKARGITFYTLPADEAKRWREITQSKSGPTFLGIKGIDKEIAQGFVDLMKRKW